MDNMKMRIVAAAVVALLTAGGGAAPHADAASGEDDGLIAFHMYENGDEYHKGELEIFTIAPDGSDLTQLTANEDHDHEPTWSPDGRRIAFVRSEPKGSSDGGSADIWVMNADGSGESRITHTRVDERAPAFSPDGTRLLFVTSTGSDHGRLWVTKADGSHRKRIRLRGLDVTSASWAPRGRRLVVAARPDGGEYSEIYVVGRNGRRWRLLTPLKRKCVYRDSRCVWSGSSPHWRADGRAIVFQTDPFECRQIARIKPDGSRARVIADQCGSFEMEDPQWSPSGGSIAFYAEGDTGLCDSDGELRVIAPFGNKARTILTVCNDSGLGGIAWR